MIDKSQLLDWLKEEADGHTSTDDRAEGYRHAIAVIESGEFDKENDWEKRFEVAFENNVRYINENKQLKRQIESYERILKWYANDYNYHILDERGYKAVENDDGEQARNVLKRWGKNERSR